jgi:uncharacterized membrane protein
MKSTSLLRAGIVLGLGLGGFLDGIVLHQILGWHHLVCTTETCQPVSIEDLQRQTQQDGFFHLATWTLTAAGVVLLFRAGREKPQPEGAGRIFSGALLVGWGVFNFVEGLIDHQLLGIHHVRPGHPLSFLYDMLFLASGLALASAGLWLARSARTPRPPV